MRIALDFDNVLADTMLEWVNNFNNKYGKSYTKDHIVKWEFWHDFKIEMEEAFEIFEETWKAWERLPAIETNLIDKTKELTEIGQVDVVSNVRSTHSEFVEKWLEKNEIHYNKFINTNNDKENLDYDYFIDDSPSLAEKLNKLQKPCLLYQQKWNNKIKGDHIKKIKDLSDALDVIG